MIGQIIGNYKIEQKLGEGGMGAVYKGVDTMLDREVAIKALRPELARQTSIVERFRSEAVTLAKLHHPNIATLYALFRQGEELYMVLEYVRGETLERVLQRRGALSSEEVIPVFCQILDGINHAHEYGIIHRDIKPANMMLTEKGTLKVLDFGIARLLGSARMTRAGNIIGTLEYMAPEQVRGLETDARSDIYALGMMLYEMLTGRTPFTTDNEFELMKLQTEAIPTAPRQINESIPQEVEAAIMRAIEKDPARRFQTAGEFRDSLLDAGFAAQGRMHTATTGNRASQGDYHRASSSAAPPINRSSFGDTEIQNTETENKVGETAFAPPQTDEIKETRLGAGVAPAFVSEQELRETRLGTSNTSGTGATTNFDAPPKSLFDNLTWIHYAGAGFAATVLLGLLAIVPIFIFSGDGNSNIQPLRTPEIKPEPDKPKVVPTPEQKQDNLPLSPADNNPVAPSPNYNEPVSNMNTASPPDDESWKMTNRVANTAPRQDAPSRKSESPPPSAAPRESAPPRREARTENKAPRENAPPKSSGDAERKARLRDLLTAP